MKYLSHFTIRAFVVLGLSLGCAKAQLSKEEVMLYFKDIDMKKILQVYEFSGNRVKQPLVKGMLLKEAVVEDNRIFYDSEKTKSAIKVTFYENSLVFTIGSVRRLFSYQHIKRIVHIKKDSGEYLFIK